jgi:hypothetical protein
MKSPWLSLWLSAANSSAGAARGFRTAQMRRQQKNLVNEAGRSVSKDRAAAAKYLYQRMSGRLDATGGSGEKGCRDAR